MKKVLLFVAVVIAASFASCKKDRTCTCTFTSGTYTSTSIATYPSSKKSAARANCLSSTESNGGVTYTTTCTLN